jgi:enoyl-CoA hydratase
MATRIVVERLDGGVVKVVLDGPPLNLNTLASIALLRDTFTDLDTDRDARCVVLAGAGSKAFCAGSDIGEFPSVRDDVVGRKLRHENEAFRAVERCAKPVVAAIEGVALGGGSELAIACDLRIAGESARFGFPEIRLGVFPGSGGLYRLPRLVGQAKALELMLLGDAVTAAEAHRLGLVNRVVPAGQALETALAIAARIAASAPEAVRAIKRGVRESDRAHDHDHDHAVELSLALSDTVFRSADCAEGVRAFFEKRPPRFGAGS